MGAGGFGGDKFFTDVAGKVLVVGLPLVCFCLLYTSNLFDRQIHLTLRFVRCSRFHQSKIQSRLSSLRRDFQHVVFAGINAAVFQSLGPRGERLHECL